MRKQSTFVDQLQSVLEHMGIDIASIDLSDSDWKGPTLYIKGYNPSDYQSIVDSLKPHFNNVVYIDHPGAGHLLFRGPLKQYESSIDSPKAPKHQAICNDCGTSFDSYSDLEKHMIDEHEWTDPAGGSHSHDPHHDPLKQYESLLTIGVETEQPEDFLKDQNDMGAAVRAREKMMKGTTDAEQEAGSEELESLLKDSHDKGAFMRAYDRRRKSSILAKSPPGRKHEVEELKESGVPAEEAFAISWSQHNKSGPPKSSRLVIGDEGITPGDTGEVPGGERPAPAEWEEKWTKMCNTDPDAKEFTFLHAEILNGGMQQAFDNLTRGKVAVMQHYIDQASRFVHQYAPQHAVDFDEIMKEYMKHTPEQGRDDNGEMIDDKEGYDVWDTIDSKYYDFYKGMEEEMSQAYNK